MQHSDDGNIIDRSSRDIIECALSNDFRGVDDALEVDRRLINARRAGSGITPLMAASGRGLNKMVDHLLSKEGVDIRVIDEFGKSAFDHGRLFPNVVSSLVKHAHPNLRWGEPKIFSI